MNATAQELDLVKSILKKFLAGRPTQALVFGSRVVGGCRPDSDLDLMLRQDSEIPLRAIALIKEALEESALPFKVDIVDYHRISDSFRQKILRACVPL